MLFMNRYEIEEAVRLARRTPEYLPYVQFLSDWKDVVDSCSDGWPYWAPPVRAAKKLMEQVQALDSHIRYGSSQYLGGGGVGPAVSKYPKPEVAAFKRALTPIKSFATKHKMTLPVLRQQQ